MIKDKSITFLALAQTLVWASIFYLFPAMLLRWESSLGHTRTELTAAITLAMLVSAAASPIAGRLIDKGKGPMMMTRCTLLGALLLIALSFAQSLITFYATWALIGIVFSGCLYEPCFALITRARGIEAKKDITSITLVAGFAGTISFPLSHLLADSFGWENAVRIFAAIVLLVAAPLMHVSTHTIEARGKGNDPAYLHEGASPTSSYGKTFWFLASGFALLAIVHAFTLQHLLPILGEKGFTADIAVLAAAFIGPMQVAGRLTLVALDRKTTNHQLVIACFVFIAASILALAASGHYPGLLIVFVALFGGAYGTASILRPVIAREILGGSQFGAKSGKLAMLYLTGAAAAPWLGSLAWSVGTYALVVPCIALLSVAGLFLYLTAQKKSGL